MNSRSIFLLDTSSPRGFTIRQLKFIINRIHSFSAPWAQSAVLVFPILEKRKTYIMVPKPKSTIYTLLHLCPTLTSNLQVLQILPSTPLLSPPTPIMPTVNALVHLHHWSFELTGLTALVSSIHLAYTWKVNSQIQIQFCYSFYFENRRSKNKSQSNDVVNWKQAHLITWRNTKRMYHQVYFLWVRSYSTPYRRTKLNKLIRVFR